MRLGILQRDHGDLDGAIAQFTAATTLQPDYSDAWRELGIQQARQTKNVQGEEPLRKAISLNPHDFDALASLGGLLRKTNRLEEAAQWYQRSVDVSGGHPYPLLMALKLRARTARSLALDDTQRRQLFLAGRMRQAQAEAMPPIDAPWCMFDLAEIALYSGDKAGFLEWTRKGLGRSEHRYQAETFRSALQLLVDGGVEPDGLHEGMTLIDQALPRLL
jgi:Flp pilus assembly protein TadD